MRLLAGQFSAAAMSFIAAPSIAEAVPAAAPACGMAWNFDKIPRTRRRVTRRAPPNEVKPQEPDTDFDRPDVGEVPPRLQGGGNAIFFACQDRCVCP